MRPMLPLLLIVLASPAWSDDPVARNGSDTFLSAQAALPAADASGDLFATGGSVALRGSAQGDVHVMGFSVEVEIPAPLDLYAAGGSVSLRAPVGSDLSAAGFSVRSGPEAVVSGNARLLGGSVVIDGPVRGALTVAGGEVTLNAPVGGDVLIVTGALTMGPEAQIGGRLVYATPSPAEIPASVIAPERVTWRRSGETGWTWGRPGDWHPMPALPAFLTLFSGTLLVVGFLTLLGAATLLIAPALVERLRQSAASRPGPTLLSGFFGLSTLFGLVPVSALTLIGLPLVPIALLLIVLVWTFGYLLGAHVLATAVIAASGRAQPGPPARILALMVMLAVLAALNFIPFIGWMLNIGVMLFGLGAIAAPLFFRAGAPLPAGAAPPPAP